MIRRGQKIFVRTRLNEGEVCRRAGAPEKLTCSVARTRCGYYCQADATAERKKQARTENTSLILSAHAKAHEVVFRGNALSPSMILRVKGAFCKGVGCKRAVGRKRAGARRRERRSQHTAMPERSCGHQARPGDAASGAPASAAGLPSSPIFS